ncbi:methyltransferase family protein [Amycolatopsis thermoflava]
MNAVAHGFDLDPQLAELLRTPVTLDVVDALGRERALTLTDLARRLQVKRHVVGQGLRILATHHVVARERGKGTWDTCVPEGELYSLTTHGRFLATELRQFDVLVAVYERLLDRRSGDAAATPSTRPQWLRRRYY